MKLRVLAPLVLLAAGAAAQAASHVLPKDTEIKVKTNTAIPAKPAANAKFGATVSNDIKDGSGNVVIPRGSSAQLVAVPAEKDTNLDLRSVTVNGQRYLLTTQEKSSAPGGLGANKRTGKYVGGGAAIGDGPVDALCRAISQVTGTAATLLHYEIHGVTSGTEALGEVSVQLEESGRKVTGRGASTDVLEASARAYIDGLNKLANLPEVRDTAASV